MSEELIRSVIQRIAVGPDRGRDISFDEARQTMRAILQGEVDEVQTAVILIALRMKRESVEEMAGIYAALQEEVEVAEVDLPHLFCLADPFDGYVRHHSMMPFLPSLLAAMELPACLVGVETVGPKFGVTAEQVYSLAGIDVGLAPQQASRVLEQHGWAYVSQSNYAPSLYRLQGLRSRIIKRSALTTLERLLNPLRAHCSHAVLGYVHKAYPEIYSEVARQAGYSTALLTKGVEGGLAPAINKPLRQYRADFRQSDAELIRYKEELPDTVLAQRAAMTLESDEQYSVDATLKLGLEVLGGKNCVASRSLILAAAHILWAYRPHMTLSQAVEKVRNCLDNGLAQSKFNALRES